MAISRAKKAELLEQYKEQINNSSALVFTNYLGASVPQLRSLRVKLKETGTTYSIVKDSIFALALEQCGKPHPDGLLEGPNAVAFVGEDIGKGVSALRDWIKSERILEIKGAILESSVLDASAAEALADLPTRAQVLAQILGAISAPAGNLVRMIGAPSASLVRVLNAYVEKRKEIEAA